VLTIAQLEANLKKRVGAPDSLVRDIDFESYYTAFIEPLEKQRSMDGAVSMEMGDGSGRAKMPAKKRKAGQDIGPKEAKKPKPDAGTAKRLLRPATSGTTEFPG